MNETKSVQDMSLTELMDYYGECKKQANLFYKQFKDLQPMLHDLQLMLTAKLNETGLQSAKSSKFTASITSRKDIAVTNESSAIEWLKEQPNVEYDFYIGLKATPFKTLVAQVYKETGEIPAGVEVGTKESLAIREVKR